MVRVGVFLFTGLVLLSSLSGVKSSPCKCCTCQRCPCKRTCPPSPCEDMDIPSLIKHLWKFPKGMTPAGEEYKTEIIRLAKEARSSPAEQQKRIYGLLLSLSLWAVDRFTGLRSPESPSCVYKKLVESSLSGCPVEQEEAIGGYHKLSTLATNYSVRVGMVAAGCPVDDLEEDDTEIESCELGDSFQSILDHSDSNFPPSLKPLIENLHRSPCPDDIVIASAAAGSITKLSVDMFATLLETDELIKVVRLKACPAKIPLKCCAKRLQKLTVLTGNLSDAVAKLVQQKAAAN
nr:LS29-like protein [Limnephilus flavicornis]